MRGFWADERVEGGLWNLRNPVFKRVYTYFKRKEQEFLRHADAIISLTENAKSEMDRNFLPGSGTKITVIPCCVDLEHFSRQDLNHSGLRDKLGIKKDDFVLLYLGSVGTWYMIDEMLDFYEVLKQAKPELRFLLLTNDQELLMSKLETRNLVYSQFSEMDQSVLPTEQILISQTTRDKVPEFIQMSDASVFFILPSFSKKASSATKMGEVLAMNIPIITNSGYGDVDMLLSDSKYGVLVKSMDTEGYNQAIKDLEHLISLPKNNIRELAETYYSLEEGVKKYKQVYEKLIKP